MNSHKLSLFNNATLVDHPDMSTREKDDQQVGLPRLRNFVNVYANSRNRNDSVYTQLPY